MQHQPKVRARMLLALLGGMMLGLCTSSALADTPAAATPNPAQISAPASPAVPIARPSALQATPPSAALPPASAPVAPQVIPQMTATPAGEVAKPAAPRAATSGAAPSFSAPSFNPPPAEKTAAEPAFEPGQVLVLWASDEAAASGLATLQQRYQLRPRQRYTLASLGFTVAMYALPSDRQARSLREQLRAEQPDWIVDLNARSVPLQAPENPAQAPAVAPRLYAQKMLGGIASSVPTKLEPPSLRLGVVDTGVDSALAQAAALNGSVIELRSVLGPADKAADTAHGSAVLQLMVGAAQSHGFAGSAPPVRVSWASAMRELNGKASTNSLLLALALDWLLEQQVSLINLSLGGQGDAILKAVVARILAQNVLILAPVGNNPARPAPPIYPAAYPGVWAITAVDAAGKLYSQASHASYTALAAPGAELWVPANGGAYVSGTSYATALASATLAWQAPGFWALPATQQRAQVCAQARKLQDETVLGCGLVQRSSH